MKFIPPVFFLFSFYISYSQIDWKQSYGPKGISYVNDGYTNSQFVFIPARNFLYRSEDGQSWEALEHKHLDKLAVKNDTIAAIKDLYVGDLNPGDIYLSFDNGSTFEKKTSPFEYFHNIVWGKKGLYISKSYPVKINFSSDNALTWQEIEVPSEYAYDLYESHGHIYAGNSIETWRLNEEDRTWTSIFKTTVDGDYIKDVVQIDSNIIVLSYLSIWTSNDGGKNFTRFPYYFDNSYTYIHESAPNLYAYDFRKGVVLASFDYGKNWNLHIDLQIFPRSFYQDLTTFKGKLILNDYNNSNLISLDLATKKSKIINDGLVSAGIYGFCDDEKAIWALTGNNMYKYDKLNQKWDTQTAYEWKDDNYGSSISSNKKGLICILPSNDTLVVSKDHGNTWKEIIDSTLMYARLEKVKVVNQTIFIFNEFDPTFVSFDQAETWTETSIKNNVEFFNNRMFGVDFNEEVAVSLDEGRTWSKLTTLDVKNIADIRVADDIIIAIDWTGAVYKSLDGEKWEYSGLDLDRFYDGFSFFKEKNNFYLYDDYTLFCSIDTCQSWFPYTSNATGLIEKSNIGLIAGSFEGGLIFGQMRPGVFANKNEGKVFIDENSNGIKDANELPFENLKIGAYAFGNKLDYFRFTDNAGLYYIRTSEGDSVKIKPIINSKFIKSIPEFYISNDSMLKNRDFAIQIEKNKNDVKIEGTYLTLARPGFDLKIHGLLQNIGTVDVNGNLTLKLDNNIEFKHANPVPTQNLGDSILIWDIGTLNILQKKDFEVEGRVKVGTLLNSTLQCKWTVLSTQMEEDLDNNTSCTEIKVVGSFDPNDKAVEPANGLTAEEILSDKPYVFTIRFQNTGNYLAEKVRIVDKLDNGFDFSTIEIIAASHKLTKSELLPRGWLQFTFEDINLPDSISDEKGSHGFVKFSISRNKDIDPNYSLFNDAEIYFDYNLPIYTNNVEAKIYKTPTGLINLTKSNKDKEYTIFPNPVSNHQFSVHKLDNSLFSGVLEIYSANGQIAYSKPIINPVSRIEIVDLNLPVGSYFINLSNGPINAFIGKLQIN